MDWFRYHHGTTDDSKLTMLAKKIGVRRCEMTAVWAALMEHASQHVTRGHTADCDLELISFVQEIELNIVEKIYKTLEEKLLIVDGKLSNWDKRQPKREDDGAAERKRLQREKEKAAKLAEKEAVKNFSHAASHNVTIDQTRPDQIRGDKKETPLPPNSENLETSEEVFSKNDSGVGSGSVGWDVLDHLRKDENGYEKAINYANSAHLDLRGVIENYNQIRRKNKDYPDKPVGAFLAWMKKIPKGKPP